MQPTAEMMRALIIGHTGQDGQLLWEFLSEKKYLLAGVSRNSTRVTPGRECPPPPQIGDAKTWPDWIERFEPDEIYYLAAYHSSSEAFSIHSPEKISAISTEVHVTGLENILAAVLKSSPSARVFYASSSFVFGNPPSPIQTETSPMKATDAYGASKIAGTRVCEKFREQFGVFVSVGILYNHESILRKPNFLSQKIIQAAIRISRGSDEKLILGDLTSIVDWGYAPDFVRAFHLILQAEKADNYIVATGEEHTVAEFAEVVFAHLGLKWKDHVEEDPSILIRPTVTRIGDSSHLRRTTGWKPALGFEAFIAEIINRALL
ncbi:MAG: GDP-mannose 4,6-dehydratase [Verrucomicrobiales bacterium]|nr:GDP-mannose 4,6-dehydratase [Verrucomicrobiales bacterium]